MLPWADRTGWMLCDTYFANGQPMMLDGRGLMRRMLGELGDAGYDYPTWRRSTHTVPTRSTSDSSTG